MPYSYQQIADWVNQAIRQIDFGNNTPNLYNPIAYTLENGGKRIRPVLMLMAYNLFRNDPLNIINNALAMEIYHNFTLLHDDVMDHAEMRRGKPCVHVKWNQNTAILSGDVMLALAYRLMTENRPAPSADADENNVAAFDKAVRTFNDATIGVCEGQQMDMDFEQSNEINEQQYMEMIRLKTSLLLACSLKIGAQLAQAPDNDVQHLYEFGEKIGLAFQLQDDWLDVYGDPLVFGKKIGGDIVENKKTFMLIKALELADTKQRTELMRWIDCEKFDRQEKILAVTSIYNELEISQLANDKINHCFKIALQELDKVDVAADAKNVLRQFALQLMNRNS